MMKSTLLGCVVSPTIYDDCAKPLAAIWIAGCKARLDDKRVVELGFLVGRTSRDITHALAGRVPTFLQM